MIRYWLWLVSALLAGVVFCSGCAHTDPPQAPVRALKPLALEGDELVPDSLHETPVGPGLNRVHEFDNCALGIAVPQKVEKVLGICSELYRHGSGSDGIIELEMALEEGNNHPLIYFTLGQLYLMAGQGNPDLMPGEGPAADVGNWDRNKKRLLGRSRELLAKAGQHLTTDGSVEFLLADVARASGDYNRADELAFTAAGMCLGGRTIQIMRMYQQLTVKPAELLAGDGPIYPEGSLNKGISGPVTLDLLINPQGQVRQAVVVDSPAEDLSLAAAAGLFRSYFQPGKIGKYPVWSWLRVTTNFNIEG
jgi:hypothetical protein